MKTALI